MLADPHTTARRTLLSGLDLEALPVFSADALPINGLRAVDPALALTRAVPAALARAPADVRRLRAVYVT